MLLPSPTAGERGQRRQPSPSTAPDRSQQLLAAGGRHGAAAAAAGGQEGPTDPAWVQQVPRAPTRLGTRAKAPGTLTRRERGGPGSQSPGSRVGGGEGSRPDSSPNFSRPPRRERRRKQSGGGKVESGIQGGPGAGGKPARVRSGGGTVDFPQGRGPSLPPTPIAGISLRRVLAGARAPCCPGSRCPERPPPRPARGSRARPRLTGRGRLDRPTGWGARRGRRAVLKLWAGTARSPSSLSLAPSLLPTFPSFPDPASRGVMSGAGRAEGEGPREAGGGPGRGRPEPGSDPSPSPPPCDPLGQFGAELVAGWGWGGRKEGVGARRLSALHSPFSLHPCPSSPRSLPLL